ncbi:alpha/beta hydrolase [Indiicoccus explosivorum]|uniref:alpha/beta hydrolase n=1 Tax=Indiicoccus explosivorum TaxID=1917864 RepID=UPI000B43BBFB|nr:alpha/beta hydrolase [Indiicoccus explosivorum]
MNRRTGAALAGSLAAAGGYFAYRRQTGDESAAAKLVKLVMRLTGVKMVLSDPAKFDEFIEVKKKEGEKPYSIPKSAKIRHTVDRTEKEGMAVYRLSPEGRESGGKRIFHLHGGGYILQPHKRHWQFLDRLAKRSGRDVIMPIYPKTPQHSYEEAFPKVLAVYKELLAETAPEDIVLLGESSGGGFALALAQLLKKEGLPQPGRLILISPWTDATMDNPAIADYEDRDPLLSRHGMKELGKLWAGSGDPGKPPVSPINGDLEGLAPVTLFAGTHDILFPDARKLKRKLEAHGAEVGYHEYPKMTHCFPLYPIPEGHRALGQIVSAMQ